jgi:hypothetical protein
LLLKKSFREDQGDEEVLMNYVQTQRLLISQRETNNQTSLNDEQHPIKREAQIKEKEVVPLLSINK